MSKPTDKPRPGRHRPENAEKPKRRPYPVNDPGFADPERHPGSEPDYLPESTPEQKPQI